MAELTRREFIKDTTVKSAGAAVGLGVLAKSTASWANANEKIRAAVIGIRGRGKSHLNGLMAQDNVEVTTLCDVDTNLFAPRVDEFFTRRGKKEPKVVQDMAQVLSGVDPTKVVGRGFLDDRNRYVIKGG